jgi:hypothetical protein
MAKKTAPATTPATTEATAAPVAKKGRAVDPNSKAQRAAVIFAECYAMDKVPARKDILAKVQQELELTPHGSATYLQNWKKANGHVQPKGE